MRQLQLSAETWAHADPAALRHRADVVSADGRGVFGVPLVRLQGGLATVPQRASAPAPVARWAHPVFRCFLHLLLAAVVLQAVEEVVVGTHEEEAARSF